MCKLLKIRFLNVLFVGIVLVACKSKLTTAELAERSQKLANIEQLINEHGYEVVAQVAFPQNTNAYNSVANSILIPTGNNASRIDLRDRSDYVKYDNKQVSAQLSFYGEQRFSRGYNTDSGISYNAVPENYKSSIDQDNGVLIIKYNVNDQQESYNVTINVYPDKSTRININSSHRTNMQYQGYLSVLEK